MTRPFSTAWNSSTNPGKQRSYRYNAPLHLRQKFLHVHLSFELRKKYHCRNTQVRVGDKVKIVIGQFRSKEGKVARVDLRKQKVYVTGIEQIRKDGTKKLWSLSPSNLLLVELDVSDKLRKEKLESVSSLASGSAPASAKKKVEKKKP